MPDILVIDDDNVNSLVVSEPDIEIVEVSEQGPPGRDGIGAPANSSWGQAIGVVANETATLVSIPSSVPGFALMGVNAHGTGDGYFFVQVAGITVFSGRIRGTQPNLLIVLPNNIGVTTGSVVTLKVTNESAEPADFEATLLGA